MYYIIFTTNKQYKDSILPVIADSKEKALSICCDNYMSMGEHFKNNLLVITQEEYNNGYQYEDKDVRELFHLTTLKRGRTPLKVNEEF